MRILIIDDEDDIRMIARYVLSSDTDVELLEADSGAEGLRAAELNSPDLILLDVMMPVMDGRATLAELRRNPATSRIPVIFLTGTRAPAELKHLKELGAVAVLPKPFDPQNLKRDILSALAVD